MVLFPPKYHSLTLSVYLNPVLWKVKSFNELSEGIRLGGLLLHRPLMGTDVAANTGDLKDRLLDALPGVFVLPHELEKEIVPAIDEHIVALAVGGRAHQRTAKRRIVLTQPVEDFPPVGDLLLRKLVKGLPAGSLGRLAAGAGAGAISSTLAAGSIGAG